MRMLKGWVCGGGVMDWIYCGEGRDVRKGWDFR